MPQEKIQKQLEQVAAGAEESGSGGPFRGFDPFMQYLLHRLDSMEANLRAEIKQVVTGLDAKIDTLEAKIDTRVDSLHQELHGTTRWIIGTIIAAAGVAVALASWLLRPGP